MDKHTRLQKIYYNMKSRCYNPNNKDYKNYGGRGIKVCDEWLLNGSKPFCDWAKEHGYQDNLTIDRIDNNRDYCPKNCRWITIGEQSWNKRGSVLITIDNQTKPIYIWSKEVGIHRRIIQKNIKEGKHPLTPSIRHTEKSKIAQYDLKGGIIKIWNSFKEIKETLRLDCTQLVHVCRHKRHTAYGYGWSYYPRDIWKPTKKC